MQERASRTAEGVLMARVISSLAPPNELILFDPFAVDFLPFPWSDLKAFLHPIAYRISMIVSDLVIGFRATASIIALRHRHIDDRMQSAYARGIRQVIILGAGYDSRAHRYNYPDLRFVEIDHPESQHAKLEIIRRQSREINKRVEYISVDLLKDWDKQVIGSGLVKDEPSFVIWEGVCNYLPEATVSRTLDAIAGFCSPGSVLIFDTHIPEIVNGESHDRIIRRSNEWGKRRGEPFLWGCDREHLPELLESHGYRNTVVHSLRDIADRLRMEDGLKITDAPVLEYMHLIEAQL